MPISTIGSGGMNQGPVNNGMTPGPVNNGMTAVDIQGWHDWVENALSASNDASFESLLTARLSAPDQQGAFMNEYQSLRTKHISDYSDGLKQGATWVPGESYHVLGCDKADQDYSVALNQLLNKYYPTLSTDPNNTERGVIRKALFDSGNPGSYTQTSAGTWQPNVQSTSSSDAVRSHGGESSFG